MQQAKRVKENVFADIIEKIQLLTPSQQRFLQAMLSNPDKVSTTHKKKLFKKSYGIGADKKDIKNSIEYIDDIRKGWGARLERIKS